MAVDFFTYCGIRDVQFSKAVLKVHSSERC